MQIRKNGLSLSLLALLFGPLAGCGSSGVPTATSPGPAGKVAQAYVSGATVWADAIGAGAGTQFVIDNTNPEAATSTTTTSAGAYTIPVTPAYKYAIVSQAGTDSITGLKATTMLAPGGASVVSPLTTMAELDTNDPSGQLLSNMNSLLPGGETFGADITGQGALTPAAMVFLTSVVTATTSFDQAIQDAATAGGATLTQQQLNDINLTLYSAMAAEFASVPASYLSNTAELATSLQTALTTAITTITTNNTNIKISNPSGAAKTIADDSVAVAANVVGLTGVTAANVQNSPGVTVPTSPAETEAGYLTTPNVSLIGNAVGSAATTVVISDGLTAASTPSGYTPPAIPIVTNPTIVGYELVALEQGNDYQITNFSITFSDDMVATNSTDPHSVLNPANYQFSQPGCTPASYSSKQVTFNCGTVSFGTFSVTTLSATSTAGVEASATSQGLLVNNVKNFFLPSPTGATGGSIALF